MIGGVWPSGENLLEFHAVLLVFQHFLTQVQGRNVRTDNSTMVAYINRQGGVRSAALMKIAEHLLVWGSEHLLSLRALHRPGLVNRGTNLMSRGGPLPDKWVLHPEVVQQIWNQWESRSGPVRQSKQHPLPAVVLPDAARQSTLGGEHVCTRAMAVKVALCLSPSLSHSPAAGGLLVILIAPDHCSLLWYAEMTLSQEAGLIGALSTLGRICQWSSE